MGHVQQLCNKLPSMSEVENSSSAKLVGGASLVGRHVRGNQPGHENTDSRMRLWDNHIIS